MRRIRRNAVLLAAILVTGCSAGASKNDVATTEVKDLKRLQVDIEGKSGSELYGSAIFIKEGIKITLQLKVEGAPEGKHAVHLHEFGDCSAEDASSAGAHWNPTDAGHGPWGSPSFHLGDIGNMPVQADGTGSVLVMTDKWSLGTGEPNDVLGKALVIHELPDDFVTQPTGAAGGRIGCGVVKL